MTELIRLQVPTSGSAEPAPLNEVAVLLHPQDDVAIAKITLPPGLRIRLSGGQVLAIAKLIQTGHKLALRPIAAGQPVRRYGQIIGFATQEIQAGEHVHTQNMGVRDFDRDYAFASEATPIDYRPVEQRRTFQGYLRPDGRVGTRNYIAILSSVNCSASTIRMIADRFRGDALRDYPNVDGVIPITHKSGCAHRQGGYAIHLLQRTLAGFARHPNVGAFLFVGLGCEVNQIFEIIENQKIAKSTNILGNGHFHSRGDDEPLFLTIQEEGGIRKTVDAACEMIRDLLPRVNMAQRSTQSVSKLMLALQCGGSDSWSGVTANPALGLAVDELVRQGGTGILSETPEIYGAEHLLTRRAANEAVGHKLIDRIKWWEHYTAINDMEMDNNPSYGNKIGGLTTIYEKSLGAVAKGGTTTMQGVYEYAELVPDESGFVYMDTPGYDPVSATGQVAGGANVIVFTTGRGSAFGFKPVPSIKVATTTALYNKMEDDMDINAGQILDGVDPQEVGRQIFEEVVAVASGKPSKSEAQGVGEEEFNPWILGATM